jgi:hypothetical protein
MSDEIIGRNDAISPTNQARLTSMPPRGKVWQVAGPIVLHSLALLVTFGGALLNHVTNDFLQKVIEWTIIGGFAASTPRGVLDAIKAMTTGDNERG